ncbi:MAG: hypothetical protein J0H09_03270 [Burkholderiales bacterium]|nr:hypothetical protein [Burkholderiales bacterium]
MKKKLLVAAMAAGLGAVGTAHAVHVNHDGTGQVLLYPYYTVQNGFDTYVHVVNTTNRVKAVKVRFLEGKNSQEVLDFNLYLSPYDEWAATLSRSANGTIITSADTSCTAPALPAAGVEFRNTEYRGDSVNSVARTREGHIEIIEMGEVDSPDHATAATHTSAGVPANCALIRTAANGVFNTVTTLITLPRGGLYGYATLINVNAGVATSVDAVALDGFFDSIDSYADLHSQTGSLSPSLESVNTEATILSGVNTYTFDNSVRPIDNVSALLMHSAIMNDYVVAPEIAAMTDWVISFPTKRAYVNGGVRAPFQEAWSTSRSASCDPITPVYYDREERTQTPAEGDFSPTEEPGAITLCNEVNTLSIVSPATAGAKVFGAAFTNKELALDSGFNAGWLRIGFPNDLGLTRARVLTDGDVSLTGLPVIGFAAMSFENGTLTVDGVNVLSNYMGSTVHKAERTIVAPTPLP